MANEIDEIKNVGKDTPVASDVKDSADSKKSKDKDKSKKAASAKKPKKGIVKYFKDCKAEFKKVVWPTPKSTTNNTIVVVVVCGWTVHLRYRLAFRIPQQSDTGLTGSRG